MLPSLEAAIIYCFEVDRLLSQVRDTVQKRKLCPQIAEARKFHAAALFVLHCGAASSFFLRSLFFDTTIPYTLKAFDQAIYHQQPRQAVVSIKQS